MLRSLNSKNAFYCFVALLPGKKRLIQTKLALTHTLFTAHQRIKKERGKISMPHLITLNLKLTSYLTALLENHVIPHPICLPAIIGEHKVRTLGPEKLTFDCDRKGTTVEQKRLRSDFLMGQNGVLYMLDDLLLPNRGNKDEILLTN
jgi:hypothetical protein